MKHLNKIIEYGILLFVFLIPWQARWIIKGGEINGGYWEYGTRSLYATEVLLGLILLAVIVKGMIMWRRNGSGFNWQRVFSSNGILLFFLIWAGLAAFWAIDRGVAMQHWVFLVLAAAVFMILSLFVETRCFASDSTRASNETPGLASLQWAIILSAALQGAMALIQFFSQSIPGSTILGMSAQSASTLGASVVETVGGRWLRAYGTFPHPNILAGWLVLGLLVWLTVTKWRSPILKWSSFVVILSGLLVSFSRSAWLAVLLLFTFYFLLIGRNKTQRIIAVKTTVTAILTITVLAALFPEPFLGRLSSSNRLEIKSTEERTASLSQSWQIIKKYPITGVGLGNYGLAVQQELNKTKPAWYYQPTHNVFLLIWSELGLLGLLLTTYYLLLTTYQKHKDWFALGLYFLPLLVLLSLDHYLWSLYPGMMILVVWLSLQRHQTQFNFFSKPAPGGFGK